MKIVFTIDHMTIGGAQKVCYNLLLWLKEQPDIEIFLIIYRDLKVGNVKFDLNDIPHEVLSGNKINQIIQIRNLLKKHQFDCLISFGTTNAMFDIPASLFTGIKTIVCERNDPAHFAGSFISKFASRSLMQLANGFVFQTKDAQSFYGSCLRKKSTVIANPLLLPNGTPNNRYDGNDNHKIVSVGRLNKQKNYPLLIDAFSNSKCKDNYTLIIIGDGPERNNLQNIVREKGLSNKVFLPGTSNQVMKDIYDASFFVLSSDFEGMPNALIEAMALGIPCISTDCPCGGPRDLITHGYNGLLFPVADRDALVSSMNLLAEDKKLAERIGEKAQQIIDTLSMQRIGNLWKNYITSIINE